MGEEEMIGRRKNIIFGIMLILCVGTASFAGMIYDFEIFNNPAYANDPQLNFTVSVFDEGQNKVSFLFENSSSISSSITAVYFDDDSVLDTADEILGGQGVEFSFGANQKSLPAGNILTPPFAKDPAFSAGSDPPTSQNGINPNEWLKITFTLKAGKCFDDVIDSIGLGGITSQNDLRIGIHIQSLPNGDSVSAINSNQPICEPATITLLSLSLLALRKRKR
jgi:hypothetical protein